MSPKAARGRGGVTTDLRRMWKVHDPHRHPRPGSEKSLYQARLPDGERNEQDVEPTTEELRGAYEHIDDADWNW